MPVWSGPVLSEVEGTLARLLAAARSNGQRALDCVGPILLSVAFDPEWEPNCPFSVAQRFSAAMELKGPVRALAPEGFASNQPRQVTKVTCRSPLNSRNPNTCHRIEVG
jgi:hypothetical protein